MKPASDESILQLEPRNLIPTPIESNNNSSDATVLEDVVYEPTLPYRGVSLKDFEQQRKLMEEQNKQKRHMLMTAIDKHAQKTEAEAKKLQEIKKELSKLDTELANDVGILRKQIENASVQFLNVQ
jgi:RAB6-interacting golgin